MNGLLEEAQTYLASDSGKAFMQRFIGDRISEEAIEELGQDALLAVWTYEQQGAEVGNVRALVKTIVKNKVNSTLRGLYRRPEGHLADPPADEDGHLGGWDLDRMAQVDEKSLATTLDELGPRVDGTRLNLGHMLGPRPYPAATSLAVLAIVHGDAEPADDFPAPEGGVAAEEGVWWAGVFYSGPDGCFPAEGVAPATVRQRRARALAAAKAAMEEATNG